MRRVWVTTLTVAGVIGSGGAAMAGVLDDGGNTSSAPLPTLPAAPASTAAPTSTAPAPHAVSYQIGAAGTVTVEMGPGGATVRGAEPAAGWTLVSATASGSHVEIVFSDGTRFGDKGGNDNVLD